MKYNNYYKVVKIDCCWIPLNDVNTDMYYCVLVNNKSGNECTHVKSISHLFSQGRLIDTQLIYSWHNLKGLSFWTGIHKMNVNLKV